MDYYSFQGQDYPIFIHNFPWKINDDSNDAQKLETYFRKTSLFVLDNYKEDINDDDYSFNYFKSQYHIFIDCPSVFDSHFVFSYWKKFILKKVITAHDEIDFKKLKREMKKIAKKDSYDYPKI